MNAAPAEGFRERRYSAQDGHSLYYRDYGDPLFDAHPVLCLTGLTRNCKDFHDFALRLAGRRRVVCPDYRGRGRSDYDGDWRNYRAETYVSDLFHLMAAANLHRVVICGMSLGGLLSMGMAVMMPAQIAGVVLNDVGPEVHYSGLSRILDYVGHDHPQPDLEAATAYLKDLFPQLGLESEEAWRHFAEATFQLGDDGQWHVDWDINLAKGLDKEVPDLWAYYRALGPLPVLALRGELSDVLSPETFARMAEVKPDLIQATVSGVGHVPVLANPQVERAIDDFLARIDSGS
jgi:pimeloyl-ACP methyl ester carboxylesterase